LSVGGRESAEEKPAAGEIYGERALTRTPKRDFVVVDCDDNDDSLFAEMRERETHAEASGDDALALHLATQR